MRSTRLFLNHESKVLPYLLPLLSSAILTLVLLAIRERMEIAVIALLYLLPVGASAAVGGLGPGIVAALISFFSLNYFFLPPYGTLMVHQLQDILVLVVFLVLAVSISQLVGRMAESLATARARENETTRLYELSLALSKLRKEPEILNELAVHTLETFHAEHVEVVSKKKVQPVIIQPPEPANGIPTRVAKIEGRQFPLGELRLWRSRQLSQAEEQLLNAYAQQAAQAVESAILTEQAHQAELLRATDKLQTSLLNSISHDLRTPLVSITGALSSLREESLSLDLEARNSLIETAYDESERLNRLVGNLLNMTRLEAGAVHLKKEPCDIQDIIGAALEQLGERLAKRHVYVNLPKDLGLVDLDSALFEQALVNLLDNAAKYSAPDTSIEINVSETENKIQIQVCDRGIGIPSDDLERIFDKFYRVQRLESVSGTGLGLAICKGIVEAHGGSISAQNRGGGGTVIAITLNKEQSL